MKLIYAVRDVVAGSIIGMLQMFPHDAPAIRFFGDVLSMPDSQLGKHPADYELIELGSVEDFGTVDGKECPRVVLTGSAWKAQVDAQAEAN